MRILVAVFIIFFFSLLANCQTKMSQFSLTRESDTTFWKKYLNQDIIRFSLPELNIKSEFVFRSWNPGSLLEITKNKDSLSGKIIFYVFEVRGNDPNTDRFVKTYILPTANTKALYEYIKISGIENIPTDNQIEGWQQGHDGITHIYELKDNYTYSFKKFWTPTSQKGIKESEFIIEFNKKIAEIGELDSYSKDFAEKVPFKTYTYSGSAYAIINPLTTKELTKNKHKRKKREIKGKR